MTCATPFLAALALVAFTGCSTTDDAAEPMQKASAEMVCSQERPTGSNIAVTRCRTAAQVEKERDAAARALGSPTRNNSPIIAAPGS